MPDALSTYLQSCADLGVHPSAQGYEDFKESRKPPHPAHAMSHVPELKAGDGTPFTLSNQITQQELHERAERERAVKAADAKALRISTLKLRPDDGLPHAIEPIGGISDAA